MTIGASIFLMAVGAILRFAVSDSIEGVDLATVGLILLLAGIVGLVIGIWMALAARRRYPDAYAAEPGPPAHAPPPAQAPPPPPPRY